MHNRRPSPFAAEPESVLKQAAQMLYDFAYLHGLNMDGCGMSCAMDALRNVEYLYAEKKVSEPVPVPMPAMPEPRTTWHKPTPDMKMPGPRADIDG